MGYQIKKCVTHDCPNQGWQERKKIELKKKTGRNLEKMSIVLLIFRFLSCSCRVGVGGRSICFWSNGFDPLNLETTTFELKGQIFLK